MAFVLDVNLRIQEILGLQKIEAAISKLKGTVQTGTTGSTAGGAKSQVAILNANASATNNIVSANDKLSVSQSKAAKTTRQAGTAMSTASAKAGSFGESVKIAGKRYAAFIVATAVPFAALGGIAKATAAVIEFDSAILKVRQILGQTEPQVAGLRDTILDLATKTGTSASEIADIGKVLVQAGQRGSVLEDSLDALSKVPLTPSFESINAALEGSIAAMNQFKSEGLSTTKVLDVLTAVSNKFAASSEDIAKGISRGGAAFEAIGGTFKEFVAVFTTVRQATRESAETVGTFLKTISSRLADPKIVDFLEGKGIRIAEAIESGNPVAAIKRIAEALQNTASIQDKIEIGTKLGGRRQISRLLALVSNVDVLNDALVVAGDSSGAFGKVAEEGLQGLQAQLNILGQEFNKLVQTLAQPLFVPIIRAVTSVGSAFVSVINVIKPIIPVFTTIIGFIAGFKALSLAITGVAAASKFLGASKLAGGLPSLVGSLGGLAGGAAGGSARERIQRRLSGQTGGVSGNVAAAGVGARVAGGIKGAAASSLGQLAIAATLFATMDKASEAFEKAGNSTGILTTEFLKGAAAIAIAASLISGKSIVGAGSAVIGFLGPFGAALAAGALAIGAFTVAANKAVDLDVQGIIDATAKRVSEIPVPDIATGDTASLGKAIDELGSTSLKGLQESLNKMDAGFSGAAVDFTSSLSNLFAGEGFTEITDSQAQAIIEEIVGENPALLNEIIRSGIEEFGISGLESGLDELFTETFKGNVEVAQRFRAGLIDAAGGILNIAGRLKDSNLDTEVSKLADAIGKAVSDFRTLRVPVEISLQLSLLSDAVGKAVKNINTNVETFDMLSQNIGQGIGLPQRSGEFTQEATRNIISTGQLGDFGIDTSQFEEITGFSKDAIELKIGLENLLKSILASKAASDELSQALSDPQVDPLDVVNKFIEAFIDASPTDFSPEAEALLLASGTGLAESLKQELEKGGIGDQEALVKKALEGILGDTGSLSDVMVESVRTFLNASIEPVARQIETFQIDAQIRARTSVTAPTIATDLIENIEDIGLDTGLSGLIGNADGANQAIFNLGTNMNVARQVMENFRTANENFGVALRKQTEAQKEGGEGAAEAGRAFDDASIELLKAQKAIESVAQAAQLSPGIRRDQTAARRERGEVFNEDAAQNIQRQTEQTSQVIGEFLVQQRQLLELQTAAEISQIFEEPAVVFANALKETADALFLFKRALTTEDLAAGAGASRVRTTPEGRVFTERAPVPQARGTAETEQVDIENLQSVLFGGPIGDVEKAIRDSANAQIKSRIQLFSRDRGSPGEEDLTLFSNLNEASLSMKDLLLQISRSNLDQRALVSAAADALRAQAAVPGAETTERLGALPDADINDLLNGLNALLINPNLAVDPRPLQEGLSQELLDQLIGLSTPRPITTEPQGAIGAGTVDSVSGIQEAASKTQLAADATAISTANIQLSSESIQQGVLAVETASTNILESATQLAAVVDTRREAIGAQQDVAAGTVESGGATEAITQTTEAVSLLGDKLASITNALETQTQQAKELAESEQQEPLQVAGLDKNTTALDKNEERIGETNDSMEELGTSMATMAGAMKDGVGIDVETMSEVNINVQGVAAAAKEFTSEFEGVAVRVAKAEIRVLLQQLAAASSNPEIAQTFESLV